MCACVGNCSDYFIYRSFYFTKGSFYLSQIFYLKIINLSRFSLRQTGIEPIICEI